MSKLKEFMKKHSGIFNIQFGVLAALLISCVVLLAVFRDHKDEDDSSHVDPVPPIGDISDDPKPPDIAGTDDEVTNQNIFEFLTLGQYKGIPIDKRVVGQKDIDNLINQHLLEYGTLIDVHGRAAQNGDVVRIEYSGSIDGVVFDFGELEVLIGSDMMIPGFEEQIIGHSIGDSFEIHVPFPDVYPNSPDLAGQDAVFETHLISIYILPELDLEFVESLGFSSVEEYMEIINDVFIEEMKEQAREYNWNQIIDSLIDSSVFHKLPNSEIEQTLSLLMINIAIEAAQNGLSLEEYIYYASEGMSVDDFVESYLMETVENYVKMELIIRAIAVSEGIIVTDTEIDDWIVDYANEYLGGSIEDFMAEFTRVNVLIYLLMDRVLDIVIDSAVQK